MDERDISILEEPQADAIPLVTASTSPISIRYVAAKPVVEIAAKDLRDDFERVTERRAGILVGTYGVRDEFDRAIDRIATEHGLEDEYESYLFSVVTDADRVEPLGADEALVIAGSDPRGTAYGVYELSRRIGVSPWYWWADVPTAERQKLHGTRGLERAGPPSVRYRGCSSTTRTSAFGGGRSGRMIRRH